MKVLIDNSNLSAGGGIQVATSFLNDLSIIEDDNQYHVIQSVNSAKQIDKLDFDKRFKFYDLTEEHKSIVNRIKKLKEIEEHLKPNVIFTVFGPFYHKSNYPKVVGFALPYIIYPNLPFFDQIALKEKIKYRLMDLVKTFFFNRNSDALVFESDEARQIFTKKLKRDIKTYTVNNTLNAVFDGYKVNENRKRSECFNILCLSANYPHKNLNIIPKIIDYVIQMKPDLKFKFNISANNTDFNFDAQYDQYINYLGRVDLENLPKLYESMDVLFMPTLLEVFSTTYLEAMYMQIPIVCSDMSFARDICAEAALYCKPTNAKDYANKILMLYEDTNLSKDLVDKGMKNLKRFGNSMDRTKSYLKIIKEITNANNQK